jgi:hypothetical protein
VLAFILVLVSWAGDKADAAILGYWFKAAVTDDQTVKYEALSWGLMAIDGKRYTRKRADLFGLLYGSLLEQNVPTLVKHHICTALAKMDGLDSSVDPLLRLAGAYKAAAAKQRDQAAIRVGGPIFVFRTGPPLQDEEWLADNLIAALWTRKSGGRSHFSGAISRFPPMTSATERLFAR